jgi:nucleolar protein 56
MGRARQKFEEYRAREDLYLMEVDRAIVDLDKTTNLIGERLEEWLSFYIGGIRLADRVNLAKLIILIADNREINSENVGQILSNKETELVLNKIMDKAKDIQEKDLVYIKRYAESLIYMNDLKLFYEEEIDSLANRIAPNATYMVGGKVVAKMISLAKGLDRISEMPASTVQLLGAENALFAFIKGGKRGDPPKHGVILFAPQVGSVKKENRGKMARTLAAKLLIAFKVDNNKGEFIGKQLKEAVERRMNSLM